MAEAWVFGYGSLVNRATHGHVPAARVRARGWRRIWRHTALRPLAFLTAIPDAGTEIDGLAAAVPGDWAALDAREAAYDRVPLDDADPRPCPDLRIYTIPAGKHPQPDATHPFLLSYLDVVIEGYLREFGAQGVARFFATTSGWDAPAADDRAHPIYARHVPVTPAARALTDRHLADLGCRSVAPPVLRS